MNTYERGIQIYHVLISAAHNHQVITYRILGDRIGVPKHGLERHLAHVFRYCEDRRLPYLTSVCVGEKTGQPNPKWMGRDRQPMSAEELHSERERVFVHRWFRDIPPTVDCFRDLNH